MAAQAESELASRPSDTTGGCGWLEAARVGQSISVVA
jgi:hypothetical protein